MVTLPWHTFTPDGLCIAMLHDLPDGTRFMAGDNGFAHVKADHWQAHRNFAVIVVAWPDGTTPTPPADDDAVQGTDWEWSPAASADGLNLFTAPNGDYIPCDAAERARFFAKWIAR